jgi:hypothetical protein
MVRGSVPERRDRSGRRGVGGVETGLETCMGSGSRPEKSGPARRTDKKFEAHFDAPAEVLSSGLRVLIPPRVGSEPALSAPRRHAHREEPTGFGPSRRTSTRFGVQSSSHNP